MTYETVAERHIMQTEFLSTLHRNDPDPVVQGHGEVDGAPWSVVAMVIGSRIARVLYAPYGPVAESPEAFAAAVEWMREQARAVRAATITVEPTGAVTAADLERLGFRRCEQMQPEYTQIIATDRPFDEVLPTFATNRRRFHRNHEKKGLSFELSDDPKHVEDLIRLTAQMRQRTGAPYRSDDDFREKAEALLPRGYGKIYRVMYEGKAIAAALSFENEQAIYYAYAAADDDYRRFSPNSVLASKMIEDACARGKKFFDFFGVVPASVTDHAWSNFSEFKRSFGGVEHRYLGTWNQPISPLRHTAAKLIRTLKNRLKR